MRIVLGIHSLAGAGGTESYVTTVADHLQRAGHDVHLYSSVDGHSGEFARKLGLRVAIGAGDLPAETDVCLAQDNISALELAERFPGAAHAFNWHSEVFDVQLPPQIEDFTRLIVVLHDNAQRRLRALAVKPPVLRLTQPIDTIRFAPQSELSEQPRRLVAVGNYLNGPRRDMLAAACADNGIEFRQVGVHGEGITDRPEFAYNGADIVVGKARVALEAMSCARAVFIYDIFGVDGWVTPERYAQMEATCFAGSAERRDIDQAALARELLDYHPAMGVANRDSVVHNHGAATHTGKLVEALEAALAERPRVVLNDGAFELARLARVNWRHESQSYELSHQLRELSRQQQRNEADLAWAKEQLAAERARADDTLAALEGVTQSRRWRYLNKLLAPFDRLRGRL